MAYFITGLVYLMILDTVLYRTADKDGQFTNIERIIVLLAWPWFLFYSIYQYLRK